MKVIDILNKIANGEEVRFRLLSDGDIFELTEGSNLYNETQRQEVRWWIDEEWLNEEIEIIEEDKKIKKIDRGRPYSIFDVADKLDEIIDYINKEK